MKKTLLLLLCGIALGAQSQTQIYMEDFESFNTIETVPGQGDFWEAWSCNDYGTESVYVSSDIAFSGTQCLNLSEAEEADVVLELGPYTSNLYTISWKMNVGETSGAYFNLLHSWGCNGAGAEWATDVYFSDQGFVYANDETPVNQYPMGSWFDVLVAINLSTDSFTILVDGNEVYSSTWSLNNDGSQGANQLQAVNFYGYSPDGSANGFYYVDDIMVMETMVVGIDESERDELSLYPNPASTNTTLNGLQAGSIIRMLDLTGKVVFETTATSSVMDLNTSSYSDGIYIVQVSTDAWTESRKLIVRK